MTHKNSSIAITSGAKDKKEQVKIDGKEVPFLKENDKFYTGLLPYSEYTSPEHLAKALIDSHPSFQKRSKTGPHGKP